MFLCEMIHNNEIDLKRSVIIGSLQGLFVTKCKDKKQKGMSLPPKRQTDILAPID